MAHTGWSVGDGPDREMQARGDAATAQRQRSLRLNARALGSH
jgi:hypothetical protein